MSNLPIATPAEALQISPEALEVANTYLVEQDIVKVANALEVSADQVTSILSRREVKAYIDHVFLNTGFNNRFRMRSAMDAIIRKKFQELEESETGSSKDIADLLELSHKMTMQELDKQIQLEKIRIGSNHSIKTQMNIQVNNGTKYDDLVRKLSGGVIENE